jgi:hypothetical protein
MDYCLFKEGTCWLVWWFFLDNPTSNNLPLICMLSFQGVFARLSDNIFSANWEIDKNA